MPHSLRRQTKTRTHSTTATDLVTATNKSTSNTRVANYNSTRQSIAQQPIRRQTMKELNSTKREMHYGGLKAINPTPIRKHPQPEQTNKYTAKRSKTEQVNTGTERTAWSRKQQKTRSGRPRDNSTNRSEASVQKITAETIMANLLSR